MKNILLIFCVILSFASCGEKSSQQLVQEQVDKYNADTRKNELYIDSLVSVAYGNGKYKYLKENRLNAINLLEKETPGQKPTLDSLRNTIVTGNY